MTLFQRSRIRNQISCLLPAVNKENPSRARPLLRSPRCPLYSQREGRPLWCKLRGDRYRTATRSGSNEGPPEGEKIRFTSTSPSDENLKSELKSSGSPRRTAKIAFTCDRCGGRTVREVNPHALAKGTIFIQCGHCDKYHQLVDNLELIEEYNLLEEE